MTEYHDQLQLDDEEMLVAQQPTRRRRQVNRESMHSETKGAYMTLIILLGLLSTIPVILMAVAFVQASEGVR